VRHLVPALGQQSTFRVRIHRPWRRHNSPTVGLNSSCAQVVYRQGRQGRGQDREYPLKGCSTRNCGCCLEKQHRKGGETSGRRAAPKPPNKATPNPQRLGKLEPHPRAASPADAQRVVTPKPPRRGNLEPRSRQPRVAARAELRDAAQAGREGRDDTEWAPVPPGASKPAATGRS